MRATTSSSAFPSGSKVPTARLPEPFSSSTERRTEPGEAALERLSELVRTLASWDGTAVEAVEAVRWGPLTGRLPHGFGLGGQAAADRGGGRVRGRRVPSKDSGGRPRGARRCRAPPPQEAVVCAGGADCTLARSATAA